MVKNNFDRYYGGGLIMKSGDEWKKSRKLYSEIFNFKLLEELHKTVEKSIEKSLGQWVNHSK